MCQKLSTQRPSPNSRLHQPRLMQSPFPEGATSLTLSYWSDLQQFVVTVHVCIIRYPFPPRHDGACAFHPWCHAFISLAGWPGAKWKQIKKSNLMMVQMIASTVHLQKSIERQWNNCTRRHREKLEHPESVWKCLSNVPDCGCVSTDPGSGSGDGDGECFYFILGAI